MLFPRNALPSGPQPYLSAEKGMAKGKGGKNEEVLVIHANSEYN
jgi:hypothetical protein